MTPRTHNTKLGEIVIVMPAAQNLEGPYEGVTAKARGQ